MSFRAEVQEWLDANSPDIRSTRGAGWGGDIFADGSNAAPLNIVAKRVCAAQP